MESEADSRDTKVEMDLSDLRFGREEQCLAVDFCSTGGVVAVAYGRTDYEDWWTQTSNICLVCFHQFLA